MCNRKVDGDTMEVACELNIALFVLKEKIPYKYTVFSPTSAAVDDPYEFIYDPPTNFIANRTLDVPKELQKEMGMCLKLHVPP